MEVHGINRWVGHRYEELVLPLEQCCPEVCNQLAPAEIEGRRLDLELETSFRQRPSDILIVS